MKLITQRTGEQYDWQYEVISRIECDGGDPGDPETWESYAAEVANDEEEEEEEEVALSCRTCGGSGWIVLSEYPTPQGEHTQSKCIDCGN